jgi:uncharacterized protein with HEPN domain
MAKRSSLPRLTDIVEWIGRVRGELEGVTLETFEADWRKISIVERGVEIISEASRSLSEELKGRHPEIPWPKIAGIGNVIRHEYQRVAPAVLWNLAKDRHFSDLEAACQAEMAAGGDEDGSPPSP